MTNPNPTMTMKLRPFNYSDWYGFAGAEKFSDGSLPLIAFADNFDLNSWPQEEEWPQNIVCIVDKTGISFTGTDGFFDRPASTKEADEKLAEFILAEKLDYKKLLAMGFEMCNFAEEGQ